MVTAKEQEAAIREHHFINEMVRCRDMLKPIVSGEIERGNRVSRYDIDLGTRKTNLKDARSIAKTVIFKIDRAIAEFDRDEEG